MKLTDGYYWYFSGEGDQGDLKSEEPQVVQIHRESSLIVMGTDFPYRVSEAHGIFKGPITPPEN